MLCIRFFWNASDFWNDNELVTLAQNAFLEANFSKNEVKGAVFSSYAEGAPGADGLSFIFYQKFWDLISSV
jgi:hypothetical protein